MYDLVTEFDPQFAAPEQTFITDFDALSNSYNLAKGPMCGRKWTEVHCSLPFVPLEDIAEEMLHPDLWLDLYTDVSEEDIFSMVAQGPDETVHTDKYALLADRYCDGQPEAQDDQEQQCLDDDDVDCQDDLCLQTAHYGCCIPGMNPASSPFSRCAVPEEPKRNRGRKPKLWWSILARQRRGRHEQTLEFHLNS